jgi:hypothetical protein
MTKLAVGMLAKAWTVEPCYDRGYHTPGRLEVVKIIAMSDKQITVQTVEGHFEVLPKSSVLPLPDHFLDAA